MKNETRSWTTLAAMSAFLIGVILFWSFGKNWLNLESLSVFLVGLVGVAVPVVILGVWNIVHQSHDSENR